MNSVRCSYEIEFPGLPGLSTEANDLYEYLVSHNINYNLPIINITNVYVPREMRSQGVGSLCIKGVTDQFKEDLVIVLAGADKTEYPEEPSDLQYRQLFIKLASFYESNSFVNINHFVGMYHKHRLYLFTGNAIGRKVYSLLQKENKTTTL